MSMKKTVTCTCLFVLILFAASSTLFGDEVLDNEVYILSTRMSSLGGPHAALTDDLSTLFHNPAGFNTAGPEISVAEITARLGGPVFDIAGVVLESSEGGGDIFASSQVQNLMTGLYATMNLIGPISFGYVGNGLGFGFFNTSNVTFSNSSPLTIETTISEQMLLTGGYSFRIPLPANSLSTIDLGFLLKGSLRAESVVKKSFLEFADLFSSLSADMLAGEPFSFISAIGFDVGALYSYNEIISFGLVGRDIFTPTLRSKYPTLDSFLNSEEPEETVNGIVPFDLSAGVLFTPRLGKASAILSDLKLMLDYNDIFDFLTHPKTEKHPLLHIGFGVELGFLEILSVRAGFYQGLLNAGLGLDLTIFTLNASMFGTELSSEPGMRPIYNLMVGLEFRF
jgi:hypothetical protein